MLNSPLQARFGRRKAALPSDCQQCRWLAHCRGGCPKERRGHASGAKLSYFCGAYQAFFAHADGHLRQLADAWLARQNQPSPIPELSRDYAQPPTRVGRNDPCPCGSGEKYKRCCGK
jgi:uncharacterized protein